MTAKEKVLAYFEKWSGKGVNPANGIILQQGTVITLMAWDNEYKVYRDFSYSANAQTNNRHYDAAESEFLSRILKLDNPKAAEIQWMDWEHVMYGQKRRSVCGEYSITRLFTGGAEAHFTKDERHDLVARGASGMAEDKLYQACQDHKQKRLEALL